MSSSSKPSLEANSNRFCDWTQHKDRITHSIEDDGEKIKDLPKLTKAYGFDASTSQYEPKRKEWGICKKRTAKERRKMNRCYNERIHQGKKSEVAIDGVVQSKEKTEREFERTQNRQYEGLSPGLPEGIEIRTPPVTESRWERLLSCIEQGTYEVSPKLCWLEARTLELKREVVAAVATMHRRRGREPPFAWLILDKGRLHFLKFPRPVPNDAEVNTSRKDDGSNEDCSMEEVEPSPNLSPHWTPG